MVRHARLLTVPLAALIVVGCGSAASTNPPGATSTATAAASIAPSEAPAATPTAAPATPPPAPSGFTLITDATVGYSIAVPASWLQLSAADAGKLESIWTQLKAENPDKAGLLEASYQAIKSGTMAFLAVDPSGATANMIVQPKQTSAGLELAKAALAKTLESQFKLPAGTVKTASVTIPAGPAVQFDYAYSLASGGTTVEMRVRQYFVAAPNRAYIVSFSCDSAGWAKSEKVFGQIIDSLREIS